jgi:hypothetical protein
VTAPFGRVAPSVLSISYQSDLAHCPLLAQSLAGHTRLLMATPRYPEGLEMKLQANRSELARARSTNESIRKELHAEFSDRVVGVVQAAKKEGENVLLAAQRQAEASLAAAREEASEAVAVARREASTTIAAARQEATATLEAAKREVARVQREGVETLREIQSTAQGLLAEISSVRESLLPELAAIRKRLEGLGQPMEDTIRRSISQEAVTSPPAADAEPVARSASVGDAARSTDNGASAMPSRTGPIDPRWIDQLWSQV